MPRWLPKLVLFLAVLGMIPFAFIARARVTVSDDPQIHIVRDMDQQERREAQQASALFADGRSMRPPVPGTVARGEPLGDDPHFSQGRLSEGGAWAKTFPPQLRDALGTEAFFQRGKERFEVFCAPCHGFGGYGDGMAEQRVRLLKKLKTPGTGSWTSPANYHTPAIRQQPVGELFNTASNGKKNMGGYRSQIPARDRWAIVAYVKALQKSQRPE